jgi:hypothetical protein
MSRAALIAAVLVAKMGPLTPMRVPSGCSQRILNLILLALIGLICRNFMPASQSAAWRPPRICEAFLPAGSDAYKKQGGKFVKRALARLITKSSAD